MYSCRPNPTIKFYLNKNHGQSSFSPPKGTGVKYSRITPDKISDYPNLLEQHRQNIIMDYKKKLKQARNLKNRLSFQPKNTVNLKVKTHRQLT